MSSERRSNGRRALEFPSGSKLSIYSNGHPVNILKVQDISPFGIGLQLDRRLDNGCRISLSYQRGTTAIEVHGTVVWSSVTAAGSDNESAAFRVGIYLQEDQSALNVTLFNAITAG
ncbi:hypothetical protein F3F96_02920 [Mariprofundus sp. NF]|uniref:PilZ domain-containing protein n=1 Tax=Mariprofundus sp. NF TaxID=2608716 RepID=UPI0015A0D883|nr:PilZ domain-containing protein [Mariprofundus sp. NF]NWF38089.1 hypothetical protein [Mariprofundus sp. NF]